jgi:hypothetical protein
MMLRTPCTLALALVAFVCFPGCEATQPKQVENPDPLGFGAGDNDMVEVESSNADSDASKRTEAKPAPTESVDGKALGGDPEFTENMSVNDAIKAVPHDAERLEIESDRLAEPLAETERFEPCKLGSGHFKARVAVWNGRAVGVDIETEPKNQALARCLDEQIREIKWADRVRSLNTVEYSY